MAYNKERVRDIWVITRGKKCTGQQVSTLGVTTVKEKEGKKVKEGKKNKKLWIWRYTICRQKTEG